MGMDDFSARRSYLCMNGNVYLNPVTEEATLRGRLGVHSMEIARVVLPQFVEKHRAQLQPEEARLLELWGKGHSFRELLAIFDNLTKHISDDWRPAS
jgi:hypothetical protein